MLGDYLNLNWDLHRHINNQFPKEWLKNGIAATEPGRVLGSCLPENETSDQYTLD